MARAPSWRCRPTTSATSSLPASTGCLSARSSAWTMNRNLIRKGGRTATPGPAAAWSTRASLTGWRATGAHRPLWPPLKSGTRGGPAPSFACTTGAYPASVTGAVPFPSFTAMTAAMCRCRKRICRWCCPKTWCRTARAIRLKRMPVLSMPTARGAAGPRAAKPTPLRIKFLFIVQADDLADRQPVLAGKLEVALVVGRHRHDGALAIAHEHVVGHPHGQLRAGQGMNGFQAGVHALFFLIAQVGLGHLLTAALVNKCRQLLIVTRRLQGQGMFGGHRHECGPHEGVGPGGKYLDAVIAAGKDDFRTFAFANPVGLHGAHPLGPAVQRVQIGQQFVGVVGNAQVIHRSE